MEHRNKKRYTEVGRKDSFTLLLSPFPQDPAAQFGERQKRVAKCSVVFSLLKKKKKSEIIRPEVFFIGRFLIVTELL